MMLPKYTPYEGRDIPPLAPRAKQLTLATHLIV